MSTFLRHYPWLILTLSTLGCGSAIPMPNATPKVEYLPETYNLLGPITTELLSYVLPWLANASPGPMMIINSPGGELETSAVVAMAVKRRGDVTCLVRGKAASGAFGILQQCRWRMMTAASQLMTHEPSWHLDGAYDQVELAEMLKDLEMSARLWNALCSFRLKVTPEEYDSKVEGKDWEMTATEALKVGAVDQTLP